MDRTENMDNGGSYVINADQTVTLKDRGHTLAQVTPAKPKAEPQKPESPPLKGRESRKTEGSAPDAGN